MCCDSSIFMVYSVVFFFIYNLGIYNLGSFKWRFEVGINIRKMNKGEGLIWNEEEMIWYKRESRCGIKRGNGWYEIRGDVE